MSAAYAAGGLPQPRRAAVVAYKEGAPCLGVAAVKPVADNQPVVDALVVVDEQRRYVNPVGARHAVSAGGAGYVLAVGHAPRHVLEEAKLLAG